jgi:hypothetical protein
MSTLTKSWEALLMSLRMKRREASSETGGGPPYPALTNVFIFVEKHGIRDGRFAQRSATDHKSTDAHLCR